MNPVLQEIYATILPSAPFIIAAYALVWIILLVYVVFSMRRFKGAEAQLALLERAIDEQPSQAASILKEQQ